MNKTSGQSCVKKVKHQVFGDGGSMSILSIQLSLDPRCHDVSTRQVCLKVELNIGGGGVDFITNLIVLDSKGIEVILGLD
jgi:hypothetical protein